MPTITATLSLPIEPETVFAFHADVQNLPRLMRGLGVRIIRAPVPTRLGDRQVIELGPRGIGGRWVAAIEAFDPPRMMIDAQQKGPFRRFRHAHVVLPDGDGSLLVDVVDFRFFGGPLGPLADGLLVAPVLRLMFKLRHRRTRALLERVPAAAHQPRAGKLA